ncbi:MAG: uroporphyrinogen-III C-methyltransferase [Rubrivivax sp.]|nr:uroporphyrinogen-III C-methyltransferase [Rubrivivax sp.]
MNARPDTTRKGHCALVGAGPGDPEWLTLKAVRLLQQATLLLVDDLVGDAIVALALQGRPTGSPTPRVVNVGKRGGCRSTPQAFIERLMVAEALAGERVVRVKGGDPFVFGRGGEEVQALRRHGIAVDVAHGITSGLAAASALGVPWTHRDHAHGTIIVTGHARDDGRPAGGPASGPDWPTLGAAAATGLTLVVYMGMAALDGIAAGLALTLPGDTPAAAVMNAGRTDARAVIATLATLVSAVREAGLASPAILIIGSVLREADQNAVRELALGYTRGLCQEGLASPPPQETGTRAARSHRSATLQSRPPTGRTTARSA